MPNGVPLTFSPGTDVPDFSHIGKDDVLLALINDPASHGQARVHAGIIQKVLNEDVKTPQI